MVADPRMPDDTGMPDSGEPATDALRSEPVSGDVVRPSRFGVIARVLLLVFIAAAVWYGLARVDWPALWRAVLGASSGWIAAGVVSVLAAHLLRAHRWRLLIPDGSKISLRNAFSATIIGYMCNNLIPRSGELARPWLLARRESRPLSTMIASVVVERIIDGLSLATVVVLLTVSAGDIIERMLPTYTATGLVAAIALPVIALIVLVVLAVKTSLGDKIVGFAARRLPPRIGGRLRGALANFRVGASSGSGSGVAITVYSVVIWVGYALGLYFGFLAFGLEERYDLGLQATLITMGITSIAITIAPTPGAFLVYHTFCIGVLVGVYGISNEEATAYAIVTHGAPYIAVTAIGAVFALTENVSLKAMLRGQSAPIPPVS